MRFPSFESSILCWDIRSLGPVLGLPGTLIRQQSIKRARTVNQRNNACQIIIKNTFSLKDTGVNSMGRTRTLSRSKSLMSTNRIPLLAPKRGDRQRMEQKLSEVWTKECLPYPGMAGHLGGHLIRTSATSVMRKISMANSTSNVSFADSVKRRQVTFGSLAETDVDSMQSTDSRVDQMDGASSPAPKNIKFYNDTFWATLQYQDPNPYLQQASLNLADAVSQMTEHGENYDVEIDDGAVNHEESETSIVVAHQESNDCESEKRKPRKPRKLLKAFSTDNIRSWFH